MRLVAELSIRKAWLMPTIHGAVRDSNRPDFRIVEFNAMGNHMHLLTEAASAAALGNGMNSFESRLAKRLNGKLKRSGTVFDGRYHVRALRTPTEVRHALRYVLLNARHHAAESGRALARGWIDPYSSAPWFDGWSTAVRVEPHVIVPAKPTAAATTWLLATGWRRLGLLSPDEIPGCPQPRQTIQHRSSPTRAKVPRLPRPQGRAPAQIQLVFPA